MGKLFRFLNFLSRDYLRNYLAVGVNLPLARCIQNLEREPLCNDSALTSIREDILRAKQGLDDVFRL